MPTSWGKPPFLTCFYDALTFSMLRILNRGSWTDYGDRAGFGS